MVRYDVDWLSTAGFKEALFRVKSGEEFAVFINFQQRRLRPVIGIVVLSVFFANKSVRTNLDFIAFTDFLFFVLVKRSAGQTNHDQHYAEMDDIAAIAAHVAAR